MVSLSTDGALTQSGIPYYPSQADESKDSGDFSQQLEQFQQSQNSQLSESGESTATDSQNTDSTPKPDAPINRTTDPTTASSGTASQNALVNNDATGQSGQTSNTTQAAAATNQSDSTSSTSSSDDGSTAISARTQQILNGRNNYMPTDSDVAPPGLSAAQIATLNNNLLGSLGDQNLQGKGDLRTLLAQACGGADASSLKTDPNVAWKAYMTLNAIKNSTGDGKTSVDLSLSGDGAIKGFSSQGDAYHGWDAGRLQDFLLNGTMPDSPSNEPKDGVTADQQNTIDGVSTSLPSADEQAPPNTTVADIMLMNNHLLANLGDQDVQGHGKLKDLLAKAAGGTDWNSVLTDKNVAWRAEKILVACKTETKANGDSIGTNMTEDGHLDGYNPSGDADRGSNAGDLQDFLLHGRQFSSLQTGGDHVHDDGSEKGGGELFWDKAGKYILGIVGLLALAIPGVGELALGAEVAGEAATAAVTTAAETGAEAATTAATTAAETGAEAATTAAVDGGVEAGSEAASTVASTAGNASKLAATSSDRAAGAADDAIESATASGSRAVGDTAGEQTGSVSSRISDTVNNLKSQLQTYAKDSVDDVKTQMQSTLDRLKSYADDPASALSQDVKSQVNNIKEEMQSYVDNPTQALKNKLSDQLDNLPSNVTQHASNQNNGNNQSV